VIAVQVDHAVACWRGNVRALGHGRAIEAIQHAGEADRTASHVLLPHAAEEHGGGVANGAIDALAIGVIDIRFAAADAIDAGRAVLGVPGGGHAAGAGHVAVGVVREAERASAGDGVRVRGTVAVAAHAGLKGDIAELIIRVHLVGRGPQGFVVNNADGGGSAKASIGRSA